MRSESDSAEFEIKHSCVDPSTPSRKRQRVSSLRPRPAENKVAGYFAPGGILDSQTTETQWISQYSGGQHAQPVDNNEFNDSDGEEVASSSSTPQGISLLNYLELQERKKHTSNSSTEANMKPSTASDLLHTLAPSPQDELVAKALEIIQIARRVAQDELEKLQETCLNLEEEVRAVTARRDLMSQDLGRERDWIRRLELTLKSHAIPFPPYPYS